MNEMLFEDYPTPEEKKVWNYFSDITNNYTGL